MKIFDHLLDRSGRVELQQIDRPATSFSSARDAFEQAHKHEQQVTASINKVYGLAMDERDFASRVFLDWFVQEQVEEEKTSGLLAEQLRMVGDDRPGPADAGPRAGPARAGAAEATRRRDVTAVGFLGLGAIGAPMAAHLARRGELVVWNRTAGAGGGVRAAPRRADGRDAARDRQPGRGAHHLPADLARGRRPARWPRRPARRSPAPALSFSTARPAIPRPPGASRRGSRSARSPSPTRP